MWITFSYIYSKYGPPIIKILLKRVHLYQGVQRAREKMVNILVNGGRKYNKSKRKNTKRNRRKHKKNRDRRMKDKGKETKKKDKRKQKIQNQGEKGCWRPKRFDYDPTKLPIIAFGIGMKRKDAVKFKGHCVGVVGVLYRALKNRRKGGGLLVADVYEFQTFKICHSCNENNLTMAFTNFVSILAYQSCGVIGNRDVNASKNIFQIANGALNGRRRPVPFCRNE